MDDFDLIVDLDKIAAPEEEQEEIVLATITAVGTDGVKIQIDGADEGGEKEYRVNSAQKFAVGDRVKIHKNSGTYLIEYKVGAPMEDYPIPTGGSDGQYLAKNGSTDYALKWVTPPTTHSIPSGGSYGYVLTKNSATDYDVKWAEAPHELPTGGSSGQVLTKNSSTNYDVKWASAGDVSQLVNGKYTLSLSSGGVLSAASSTYRITLGTSQIPFNGCYINGTCSIACNTSSYLGFFGTTPVRRQSVSNSATVATLISTLKTYGLIS